MKQQTAFKDKNNMDITIGAIVDCPDPNDSDIHANEFRGVVIDFHDGYATVEDGDSETFDFEPERLQIVDEENARIFTTERIDKFLEEEMEILNRETF